MQSTNSTRLKKAPLQMKWAKSKKLLAKYIDDYNSKNPLSKQVRGNHKYLAEYLLHLQTLSLSTHQSYQNELKYGHELPMLLTNNAQLAKEMKCTRRSIIDQRNRLKLAGIITEEKFRGSNACYGLRLNIKLIHIQTVQDSTNINRHFDPDFFECGENSSDSGQYGENFIRKSFPHSVSCYYNSKLSKLDVDENGVSLQQQTDSEDFSNNNDVGKSLKSVENPEKVVENPRFIKKQDTFLQVTKKTRQIPRREVNPPPVAARPPQKDQIPPFLFEQAVEGLPEKEIKTIRNHVGRIIAVAMRDLYRHVHLVDTEVERTRAVLAEYLAPADPDRYEAGVFEIMERIKLVKKWIDRRLKAGKKAYVPIPSIYFDYRNPKGFRVTKKWFKKHQKERENITNKITITKAVRQYNRAKQPGSKLDLIETYRKISQRLGKKDPELLSMFNQMITADEK